MAAVAVPQDACLQAELSARPGFSGVALLRQAGRTRVAVQDEAGAQPLDTESRFNVGSAGKMFTTVAVAQLVEAGRLGLERHALPRTGLMPR